MNEILWTLLGVPVGLTIGWVVDYFLKERQSKALSVSKNEANENICDNDNHRGSYYHSTRDCWVCSSCNLEKQIDS